MDKESVNTIITYLADHLKTTGIPIERIILFGSGSTQQMNPNSDLDIAIISPAFKEKTIFERADMTSEAEIACIRKFRIPLDIITMTEEELQEKSSVIAYALREGIEVPI